MFLLVFFILHFGLFHFVYFIFLLTMFLGGNGSDQASFITFIKSSLAFLVINTLFLTGREVLPGTPNYPAPSFIAAYARIVPIHLLIMITGLQDDRMTIAFLVFMILKVFFDLLTYVFTMPSVGESKQKKDLW